MFKKNKENFICEKCGLEIIGSGYTNHCPRCLWSKHVDIDPGDRMESCRGLMEPVNAEESNGGWSLIHKCQKCGAIRKNKISKEDNFDEIIKASSFKN